MRVVLVTSFAATFACFVRSSVGFSGATVGATRGCFGGTIISSAGTPWFLGDERFGFISSRRSAVRDDGDDRDDSHFYSRKSLDDHVPEGEDDGLFRALCVSAGVTRPSRVQSLAWPALLRSAHPRHVVVADQTGSGKTLAYLLPALHDALRHRRRSGNESDEQRGRVRVLVLCPTPELAAQVRRVCASVAAGLDHGGGGGRLRTTLLSSADAARDQARELKGGRRPAADVVVSTPGRAATLARSGALRLDGLRTLVLDEVDTLLSTHRSSHDEHDRRYASDSYNHNNNDPSFASQLRAIGKTVPMDARFVFATATLPDSVTKTLQEEFGATDVKIIKGPGLHRAPPTLTEHLVDVSVPSDSNRDRSACDAVKTDALLTALRRHRVPRALVFCNTVASCRLVENALKRRHRGRSASTTRVGAYHNGVTSERREAALRAFCSDNDKDDAVDRVLVCTDRAARGVDFAGRPVDHVVVFDFPRDPAEYVRRVGRTARAGRTGRCTVLAHGWQLPVARRALGKNGSVAGEEGFFRDEDDEDDLEFASRFRRADARRRDRRTRPRGPRRLGDDVQEGGAWRESHARQKKRTTFR